MVIVAGHLTVDPEQSESDLAGRADGCLDFAITADLIDPARINPFGRSETHAAVRDFRYDIADAPTLFGKSRA